MKPERLLYNMALASMLKEAWEWGDLVAPAALGTGGWMIGGPPGAAAGAGLGLLTNKLFKSQFFTPPNVQAATPGAPTQAEQTRKLMGTAAGLPGAQPAVPGVGGQAEAETLRRTWSPFSR
jgi:hypothetical protein